MKKNNIAHSGAHGIWVTALGYAINAKPGPVMEIVTHSLRACLQLTIMIHLLFKSFGKKTLNQLNLRPQ